jgi:hypothetical protein
MSIEYKMRLSPIIGHRNLFTGNLDSPPVTIDQRLVRNRFSDGASREQQRNTQEFD